jgi:hypothetical protein
LLAAEYRKNLEKIEAITKLTMSATEPHALYQCLVENRLAEHLNDASLSVREMHLTKAVVHSEDLDDSDEEAIDDAAEATIKFLTGLVAVLNTARPPYNRHVQSPGFYDKEALAALLRKREYRCGNSELRRLLHHFTKTLNSTFVLDSTDVYDYELHVWDELLLSLAEDIEALLGDLRHHGSELAAGIASLSLSASCYERGA